jgi:hypothetical protein
MKLFRYEPYRSYTFGSIIVAANTLLEADEVVRKAAHYTPVKFVAVIKDCFAKGEPRIVENTAGEE